MAANVYVKRFDIISSSGWVKLSTTPLVVDASMQAGTASQISIRFRGGSSELLTNGVFRLEGVDLSELEISTQSMTSIAFVVVANTRR